MFWVDLTFEWYEDAMVFCVFVFISLFRTTVKKEFLNESDFRHCYDNFYESAILNFTWSQLCWKDHLNSYEAHWQYSIFKDALQLKILRMWINIRAKSFIKTWRRTLRSETFFSKWKPFKNDEKCFLFDFKNFFRSEGI